MEVLDYLKRKSLTCVPGKKITLKDDGFGPIQILKEKTKESYPKAIRMIYVKFDKHFDYSGKEKLSETYSVSTPYRVPEKMSLNNACKVISYLSDYTEQKFGIRPAGIESVTRTSSILDQFGFTSISTNNGGYTYFVNDYNKKAQRLIRDCEGSIVQSIDGVIDLFTFVGDFVEFRYTDLHDRYFNWYNYDISQEEVQKIYKKLGIEIEIPAIEDRTM